MLVTHQVYQRANNFLPFVLFMEQNSILKQLKSGNLFQKHSYSLITAILIKPT